MPATAAAPAARPDPLLALVDLPGVATACDEARDAVAAAHRHRVNLRGWPTTSAEAALRGARASAGVEGASVRLDDGGSPADPVLAGALRVSEELVGPALERTTGVWTRAPLQVLARLHARYLGGERGPDGSEPGRPRADAAVTARLQGVAALVTGGTSAPAPVRAAVVLAELESTAPFGSGDGVLARAAARLVTVSTGLDPHALGVPEVSWYRDPVAYRSALAGYGSGTPEGVAAWIRFVCAALVDGAREATSIAEAAA